MPSPDRELPPPLTPAPDWPFTAPEPVEISPEELERLPVISVITPSYQQGRFIEQTVRSILLQGYPKLEYIIMDGGSTDMTLQVIQRYEDWITHWESAPDGGQADAIQRGWARATGDLVAWLNSDDWYAPGALLRVGRAYAAAGGPEWIAGAVQNMKAAGSGTIKTPQPMTAAELLGFRNHSWHQPGMFWRRDFIRKIGALNQSYHIAFDHEYWVRSILAGHQPLCLPEVLTFFRIHADAKTGAFSKQGMDEFVAIKDKYRSRLSPRDQRQVEEDLRKLKAEYLEVIARGLVRQGRRGEAVRYVLEHRDLLPLMGKAYFGVLGRAGFTSYA
jgi:glycosyltransferase involved in cell wall biosynthesis